MKRWRALLWAVLIAWFGVVPLFVADLEGRVGAGGPESGDDAELSVDEPANESLLFSERVTIRGSAPPRALVRRDVRGQDKKIKTDEEGYWEHEVKLKRGKNTFKFHLDGQEERVELVLFYERDALTIDEPASGATVATQVAVVRGSAPPGAEVRHDIAGAPDEGVRADDAGHWEYQVRLDPGENVLKFYLKGWKKESRLTLRMSSSAGQEPAWEDGVPLTDDSVRAALADADQLTRSVDLDQPKEVLAFPAGAVGGGIVSVTYRVESVVSETDLLTIAAQTSYSAMRKLFANPQVTEARVTIVADWTDIYGKTAEEESTFSMLTRATVEGRIDWDGLKDRVYEDNKLFFCISDHYEVHPAIYARLKDRGCLTSRTR